MTESLLVPRVGTATGQRSFAVNAPTIDVKNVHHKNKNVKRVFMKKYKTLKTLFAEVFGPIEKQCNSS